MARLETIAASKVLLRLDKRGLLLLCLSQRRAVICKSRFVLLLKCYRFDLSNQLAFLYSISFLKWKLDDLAWYFRRYLHLNLRLDLAGRLNDFGDRMSRYFLRLHYDRLFFAATDHSHDQNDRYKGAQDDPYCSSTFAFLLTRKQYTTSGRTAHCGTSISPCRTKRGIHTNCCFRF